MSLLFGLFIISVSSFICIQMKHTNADALLSVILLRSIVYAFSEIAVITLILGLFGMFVLYPVIALQLSVSIVIFRYCGFAESRRSMILFRKSMCRRSGLLFKSLLRAPMMLVAIILVTWQIIWCGLLTGLLPVYAFDDLAYHLPLVAGIVESGSLEPEKLSYSCNAYYAGTIHWLYAWTALLGRDSHLLSLMHWFFWIVAGLAGYCSLRILGIDRSFAVFLSACAVSSPIFILESLTAYVDIAPAAFFSSILAFSLQWRESGSKFDLAALACSIGFLQGSKPHTPIFVMIVFLWLLILLGSQSKRLVSVSSMAWIVSAVIIGSYWIGFRTVRFGNPVYPFEVRLGSFRIFEGPTPMSSEQLTVRSRPVLEEKLLKDHPDWFAAKLIRTAFTWLDLGQKDDARIHVGSGGYGSLFSALLVPAGFAGMFRKKRLELSFLFLVTALFMTPLAHVARYTSMLPFVFLIPAGLWLKTGGSRWIPPAAMLSVMTTYGCWAPDLMNSYGLVFYYGFYKEMSAWTIGKGSMLFLAAAAMAGICRLFKVKHWQASLFLPVLIVTIFATRRIPNPEKILEFAGYSHEQSLYAAWEIMTLTKGSSTTADVEEAIRVCLRAAPGETITYTGNIFPPAIGLYYDRAMTHRLVWRQK